VNLYDLDPQQQREVSFRRLKKYLRDYVQPYHPYYRKTYREQGIDLDQLKTPDDIRRLPITDKDDLRNDPRAFILQPKFPGVEPAAGIETAPIARGKLLKYAAQAVFNQPREFTHLVRQPTLKERIRRRALLEWWPIHFHASTGSTGEPTPAVYTYYDLRHAIRELASAMILPKVRDPDEPYFDFGDRSMNIFPGAPHLAFFAPVLAKPMIGVSTFDTFGGSIIPTDRQITLFEKGEFASITSIPSYMVHWLRRALLLQQEGVIGPLDKFRHVLLGAEPLSESLRDLIRSVAIELGAPPRFRVLSTLGMTEMKWAFLECT